MRNLIEYVEITAAYSNAVFLAVLPHISDFAQRLELPIETPITARQVAVFSCDNHRGEVGGALELTNGLRFWFTHGYVDTFETPRSFSVLQDPERIPQFFGHARIGEDEAIELARETIRRMGYSPEQVYADLRPRASTPPRVGTNQVPRFVIEWLDPKSGGTSARFEIDAQEGSVARFFMPCPNLWRNPPQLNPPITPPTAKPFFKSVFGPVNPRFADALLPAILPQLDKLVRQLDLPIATPISRSQVTTYACRKYYDRITAEIELANGYRFVYLDGYFAEMYAPDQFFSRQKGVLIKDYVGDWNLSEREAIAYARECVRRMGLDGEQLGIQGKPQVRRPHVVYNVPRLEFLWQTMHDGHFRSTVRMEIDAEAGSIKKFFMHSSRLAQPLPEFGIPVDP